MQIIQDPHRNIHAILRLPNIKFTQTILSLRFFLCFYLCFGKISNTEKQRDGIMKPCARPSAPTVINSCHPVLSVPTPPSTGSLK